MTKPAKPKRHRHLPHRNFYDTATGDVHWCECGAIQYRRNVGYEPRWVRPKKEKER